MIVEIAANWKTLSVVTSMVLGAAAATYGYIDSVDERLDDMERDIPEVVEEVQTNRCVILSHHNGTDPMECLDK